MQSATRHPLYRQVKREMEGNQPLTPIAETCGSRTLTATCLGLALCVGTVHLAWAQSAPLACIAELKKEYGASAGLKVECDSGKDCTFQAPTGNASARALVDTIAKHAEDCFKSAGLKVSKEDKQPVGTTRLFNGEGEGKCALLISTPSGDVPEGVRAVCQSE